MLMRDMSSKFDTLDRCRKLLELEEESSHLNVTVSPKDMEKRLARLELLRARMSVGKDIARRDLKNALTTQEWEAYENENEYYKNLNHFERPHALNKYIRLLRIADFYNSRADSTRITSRSVRDYQNRPGCYRLRNTAQTYYEKALEYLVEQLDSSRNDYGMILMWLDRPVDMTHGNEPSLDPVSMPRVRGSRSKYCLSDDKPNIFMQRRLSKYDALVKSIDSINQMLKA